MEMHTYWLKVCGFSISVSGAVQQGQSQPMTEDNNAMRSAQHCQDMLMQGANQLAQTATAQMTAAQSLAASAPNPETQLVRLWIEWSQRIGVIELTFFPPGTLC